MRQRQELIKAARDYAGQYCDQSNHKLPDWVDMVMADFALSLEEDRIYEIGDVIGTDVGGMKEETCKWEKPRYDAIVFKRNCSEYLDGVMWTYNDNRIIYCPFCSRKIERV